MNTEKSERCGALLEGFRQYHADHGRLRGISDDESLNVLVNQMIESERRIRFVQRLLGSSMSLSRADPDSPVFDPIRASALASQEGQFDQACWLAFLATYFGKHRTTGWQLCREIYGALGERTWAWVEISNSLAQFEEWLIETISSRSGQKPKGHFGNHRKYETLKPESDRGILAAFRSYIELVNSHGGHEELIEFTIENPPSDRGLAFDTLYHRLDPIVSFGRTGRFDLLALLKNLDLAIISPERPYLPGASGPLVGAKLLILGSKTASARTKDLEQTLQELDRYINIGMQAMEDSICNWQKSPRRFIPFRG